jgi:MFS family permease
VGLGLGIAGLVSLAVGVAVGHLADRHGARGIYAATLVVQALATAGFVLADGFWPFVLAVCTATGAKAAGLAARSPLIRRYGGDRPQEFRACLRAVTNVGISLGALLAGWVVQVDTLTAYRLLVVGNAIAFAASAAILVLLPPVTPAPAAGGPRWIVAFTTAPRWLVSGTMVINTVIVIAFQVRASRGIDSPAAGGGAYRRSGVAFLVSCSLISLSAGIPAWAAATLLMTAVVIHTIGELWHSAGGFEVSFALAPEHATGQYLGVFGLAAPRAVRWAQRGRQTRWTNLEAAGKAL